MTSQLTGNSTLPDVVSKGANPKGLSCGNTSEVPTPEVSEIYPKITENVTDGTIPRSVSYTSKFNSVFIHCSLNDRKLRHSESSTLYPMDRLKP